MFLKIFRSGNLKKLFLKALLVGLVITISITGFGQSRNSDCTPALPSFTFPSNSQNLTVDAKARLAIIASLMKDKPTCNVIITLSPALDKHSQSLCEKRLYAIKIYLIESLGIFGDRIMTGCFPNRGGKVGNVNTVDVRWNY